MDDLDRASELEEKQRAQAMLLRLPQPQAMGYCWNCAEKVGHGMTFCCRECVEDYSMREEAKQRNGG